jgi:hypothetical protein
LLAGGLPQQNFKTFWRANLQLLPTAEALEREREREREREMPYFVYLVFKKLGRTS